MSLNVNDIGAPSADSFKFGAVGDTIKGTLTYVPSAPTEQANKFNPGQVDKVIKLVLATDDGEKAIWPRVGSTLAGAIADAVRAAGCTSLEIGGTLAVRFSETEDVGKGNPMKRYVAQYKAPAAQAGSITATDLI